MHRARPMAWAIGRATDDEDVDDGDDDGAPSTAGRPLSAVSAYAAYFRCDARHCYHPDENAAVIITELMGGVGRRSAVARSAAARIVNQWRTDDYGPLRL